MNYNDEVKNMRTSMCMNRREFCNYFEIPYRTVSDWEAGKRKIPPYLYNLMIYKAKKEKMYIVEVNND